MILVPPRNIHTGPWQHGRASGDPCRCDADAVGACRPAGSRDLARGCSFVGAASRDEIYGEFGADANATRMLRTQRHKLIYYPVGNRLQLFDPKPTPTNATISPKPRRITATFWSR